MGVRRVRGEKDRGSIKARRIWLKTLWKSVPSFIAILVLIYRKKEKKNITRNAHARLVHVHIAHLYGNVFYVFQPLSTDRYRPVVVIDSPNYERTTVDASRTACVSRGAQTGRGLAVRLSPLPLPVENEPFRAPSSDEIETGNFVFSRRSPNTRRDRRPPEDYGR